LRHEIAQYDRYLESVRYEMHDPPALDLEVSGAFSPDFPDAAACS
jgi:hypothetical protein